MSDDALVAAVNRVADKLARLVDVLTDDEGESLVQRLVEALEAEEPQ